MAGLTRIHLRKAIWLGAITALLTFVNPASQSLASGTCVDLFAAPDTTPGYVFKDQYTSAEDLRRLLTNDPAKVSEARSSVKNVVRAAYKRITEKSKQVWEKLQTNPAERTYDVVVVGLGPTGSAAISKIVTEYRAQHGRNPRVLIVGEKVGGTFANGKFYLNTGYTFAPSVVAEGPRVSVFGFSPHRGIGAVDPLELELGIDMFRDKHLHSRGESQVSPSNAVNGSLDIKEGWGVASAIKEAEKDGEIYVIRKTSTTSSMANVLLNKVLNGITAITVMFQSNTSIANAVAVELARLNVDVIENAYVATDRGASGPNRLTIAREGREVEIDAKLVARFTGPGIDKNPFDPQSVSGQAVAAAQRKGIDSRLKTTTDLQAQLLDPNSRDRVLGLMKDGVLFVGNGDSTLVTAEAVLGFVPGKDLYAAIPKEFREAMRTKFAFSRMSPQIVEDLFQGNARKRRNGEDSVSRAPLIPDRYRSLLEFLRGVGQDPQQAHRLVDAYITEIKEAADGGYDVTFQNPETKSTETKHFGFVVLGTGRAVDVENQYKLPNSRFAYVKAKITDFFTSLSGRNLNRTQFATNGQNRPKPELTPEEIAQAPEQHMFLYDDVNRIVLGGFQAGSHQGIAEDMAKGEDYIVSIGARTEITVRNSAAMPYTLPRASFAGTWIVQTMNKLGLWSKQ